jgi:hypothetical protein
MTADVRVDDVIRNDVAPPLAPWDTSRPARRLVRLLRRNAVAFQAVFAVLWSVRLAAQAGPWEVPVMVAAFSVLATRRAFVNTDGLRARDEFRTPRGRAFLRPVTRISLWQIAASAALPLVAGLLGFDAWAMPLVAVTIGLLLVGLAASLQLTSVKVIGAMATVASVVLPFLVAGTALAASISTVMVVALVSSMWCCARETV